MTTFNRYGGGTANLPLGTLKRVIIPASGASTLAEEVSYDTIQENGTWIKENSVYLQSDYADLKNEIGLLNASNLTPRTSGITSSVNNVVYGNNGFFISSGLNSSGPHRYSSDGENWQTFVSNAHNMVGVAYGNNLYVAVSNNGTSTLLNWNGIVTSTDLITWSNETTLPKKNYNFVKFLNNTFLAGTTDGRLMTTTDGVSWTEQVLVANQNINDIEFADGVYMAGAGNGYVYTSTDLSNWRNYQPIPSSTSAINNIFYDQAIDRFIINSSAGHTVLAQKQTTELIRDYYKTDDSYSTARSGNGYTTTYSWTAPAGVTSVDVVAIGGGGGGVLGLSQPTFYATGAAGGGLGWKNNISVTPGQNYVVGVAEQAGRGQNQNGGNGAASYFIYDQSLYDQWDQNTDYMIGSEEIVFDIPGTHTWIAPPSVTSVCVVCVGGGGAGQLSDNAAGGGGGGGLGWKNNIAVTPGQSYTVVVGKGGNPKTIANTTQAESGGNSYFINNSTVAGFGGEGGKSSGTSNGGTFVGDGGGAGGAGGTANSFSSGGGGAGGYLGNGGNGGVGSTTPTAGTSGAGGGGGGGAGNGNNIFYNGSGGGVDVYGVGDNGLGGTLNSREGQGGSGGGTGSTFQFSSFGHVFAGTYGGGGGGLDFPLSGSFSPRGSIGGSGAVRIIWGAGKSFPYNASQSSTYGKVLADGFVAGFGGSGAIYNPDVANYTFSRPKGGGYVGDGGGAGGDGGVILNTLWSGFLARLGGSGAAAGYNEQGRMGADLPPQNLNKLTPGKSGGGTSSDVVLGTAVTGVVTVPGGGTAPGGQGLVGRGRGYSGSYNTSTFIPAGAAGGNGSSTGNSIPGYDGAVVISYYKPVEYHFVFDEGIWPLGLGSSVNFAENGMITHNGNLYILTTNHYLRNTPNSSSFFSNNILLYNLDDTPNSAFGAFRIAYGDNLFLIANGGQALTTTNLVEFTPQSVSLGSSTLRVLTYLNNKFIAIRDASGTPVYSSNDGSNWSQASISTSSTIKSITYGNSLYVMVGNSGYISTATDIAPGVGQTARTSNTTSTFNSVIYTSHNNLFVAGGNLGVLRTSTDGITWTTRTATSSTINGIIYGNNTYVIFGTGGMLMTSADAITWTTQTNLIYKSFTGIEGVYDSVNNRFIIRTDSGSITSTDAIDWRWFGTNNFYSNIRKIEKLNGTYVRLNGERVLTSTNLGIWELDAFPAANTVRSVVFANNQYVRTGDTQGYSGYSYDLKNWYWNVNETRPTNYTINQTIYANNKFIHAHETGISTTEAVNPSDFLYVSNTKSVYAIERALNYGYRYTTYGNNKTVFTGNSGRFVYSENGGLNWYITKDNTSESAVNNIVFDNDNNRFLYLSSVNGWGTSTDGKNFNIVGIPTTNAVNKLSSVNGKILGGLSSGYIINSVNADSLNFNLYRMPGTTNAINSVTYGNGKYVAVGQGGIIFTSTDERAYSLSISNTTSSLNTVIYGNGLFVAGGAGGAILTSTDGIAWDIQTSNTTSQINEIVYENNLFVAIGNTGNLCTSTDAITWTTRTFGTTNNLFGIAYGNDVYVIVAQSGIIRTSTDTITWTARTSNTSSQFNTITFNPTGQIFYAAGNSGTMRSSTDGITWNTVDTKTTSNIKTLVWDGSNYIFVSGTNNVGISQNGTDWKNTGNLSINGTLGYGNNIYLASNNAILYKSQEDGYNWTQVNVPTTSTIVTITYGNGLYVYSGNGGMVATSTDTSTWNTINLNRTDTLYCFYKDNLYLITGSNGYLVTSTDGTDWVRRYTGTTGIIGALDYGNNKWVVANQNTSNNIFSSNDITSLEYSPAYDATTEFFIPNFTESQTIETVGFGQEENFVLIYNSQSNVPLIFPWSDETGFGLRIGTATLPVDIRGDIFFHPSMKAIITGQGSKPSAFIFNTSTGLGSLYAEATLPAGLTANIDALAISPDGKWVIAGYSTTPWLVQWEFDVDRGFGPPTSFSSMANAGVSRIEFDTSGTELFIYYSTTGRNLSFTETGIGSSISTSSYFFRNIKYRPNNNLHLAYNNTDNTIPGAGLITKNANGTLASGINISTLTYSSRSVNWDPSGNNLVVSLYQNNSSLSFPYIEIYNISSNNTINYKYPDASYSLLDYRFLINPTSNHTQYMNDASFSPSGSAIILTGVVPRYSTSSSTYNDGVIGAVRFENEVGITSRYSPPLLTPSSIFGFGTDLRIRWGTVKKNSAPLSQANQITYIKAKL